MQVAHDKGTILIVEDDRNTSSLVSSYLEREGFSIVAAFDGEEALTLVRQHQPVFVILDLMLPKIDGWEVCRQLRSSTFTNVPILMLTAREEEIDRVTGLSIGADDYVVKPFSPREVVERVKAILRRVSPVKPAENKIFSHQGLLLDPDKHKITLHGHPVNLTLSEFKLLHILMSSPGRVFSRQELLDKFYPNGEVVIDRVIDVHIGKLRQKLEENPSAPRFIITVRGFGYRFADVDES